MAYLPELKAEIVNDPFGRGYSTMTDEEITNSLNTITDQQRNRQWMTREEIYSHIEPSALNALTAVQVAQLNLALSDQVNPFGNAAQVFLDVFGEGSQTIINLAAARIELVSRAEYLGLGKVRVGHIGQARAL